MTPTERGHRGIRVVVAGASGFVGRAFVASLAKARADRAGDRAWDRVGQLPIVAGVRGLTRSASATSSFEASWDVCDAGFDDRAPSGFSHAVRCDLFSLVQAEEALAGADVAVYLVHSMMPSTRLVQGSFADIDLLLADNFARAAKKAGVRRIVYLGGLLPAHEKQASEHLESRREVEEALSAHGVPVRVLRAGVILGKEGSSTEIMFRLVQRLPLLVCPSWTLRSSSPIALDDAIAALQVLALEETLPWSVERPALPSPNHVLPSVLQPEPLASLQVFDGAGPDAVRYLDLLKETARLLGRRRVFLRVPFVPPKFSALWVSAITGFSRELVAPLVESLRYDLMAREERRVPKPPLPPAKGWREALASAHNARAHASVQRAVEVRPAVQRTIRNTVVSIQRHRCPGGWSARDVASDYARWLPLFFRPLLKVDVEDGVVSFRLNLPFVMRSPLLVLELAQLRSDASRQLFYIRGGLLAVVREGNRGRLEFRIVNRGRDVLSTVLDFEPALPWPLYRVSQALVHLVVMRCYGARLWRKAKLNKSVGSTFKI